MKRSMFIYVTFLISLLILNSCSNCNRPKRHPVSSGNPAIIPVTTVSKPVYNIYLENSGSMDGYVSGITEFEQAIYNFLVDITNNELADSINLFYINSIIIPNKPEIADFIENLEPETFRKRGGNRSTSNMSNMFRTILENTEENTVSVFISDCVFSPGGGIDAHEYLVNQQIAIKNDFAQKLNQTSFTTVLLQLNSQFKGYYYNRLNQSVLITGTRPYYIWLFGKHEFIADLLGKINLDSFKGGGVKNFYCIYNGEKYFDHGILMSPKLGTFERDKNNPKTRLLKAKKADKGIHEGKFQFSVGVNYQRSLLNEDFIMDPSNYKVMDNYELEIIKCNIEGINYSHILKLTTNSLKTGTVTIRFFNSVPEWIKEINSEDDQIITVPGETEKTFGFRYLVEGIYEAYKLRNNNNDNLYEINISVNQ